MKLKSPAASRAVSFFAVALVFCLMAFPVVSQAKASATDDFRKFEKSTLVTPCRPKGSWPISLASIGQHCAKAFAIWSKSALSGVRERS